MIIMITMTTTTKTTTIIICGLMKSKWLSVIKREVVERQLAPNQLREDQEEQTHRPNSEDEDSHNNTPPAARSYEAEGKAEYLDKIKEWMQSGSERPRIPSLKTNSQKNLKDKTKEVNDILRLIHTNNITETNNLVATCRSKNGSGTNEKKATNQPLWKRCLEKQLTKLRAELSKLNEMSASRLQNKKVRKELNETGSRSPCMRPRSDPPNFGPIERGEKQTNNID